MRLLALDTATTAASAAVLEDGALLGITTLNLKKPHSQIIMPLIEDLLENLSLQPSDMDCFAVSKGPGSFTGIRIGIAAAKGLGAALGKPVVGVGSLEALAFDQETHHLICPLIDARRTQVYNGLFQKQGGTLCTLCPPQVSDVRELAQALKERKTPVLFTGDGVAAYQGVLTEVMGRDAWFPSPFHRVNSAAPLAALAMAALEKGEPQPAEPDYLIPSYVDQLQHKK